MREHSENSAAPAVAGRARRSFSAGQSLVEYALIIVMVASAAGITLALTGPAIGNVFSNVIFGVIGAEQSSLVGLQTQGRANAFWATVEFVRTSPQKETPFPTPADLPATLPPTIAVTASNTPTITLSPTPTFTLTPSITLTPSLTPSFTPGAPPTPTDTIFNLPHSDVSANTTWWRLDNAFGIGGGQWNVVYYNQPNFAGSTFPVMEFLATSNGFVDNDWGTGNPGSAPTNVVGYSGGNHFSAVYEKTFLVPNSETIRISYTIGARDALEIRLDGTTVLPTVSEPSGVNLSGSVDVAFTAGTRTLQIRYNDDNFGNGNPARLSVSMARLRDNIEDTVNDCGWLNISDTAQSGSSPLVWDEGGTSAPTSSWTAGRTCILELRGAFNLTGQPSPKLSWWDIWDFSANSGVNAQIQIGDYTVDANGFFNRAAANWRTFTIRSGGTANYNWTRNQIDLSAISGLSSTVTVRFVLTSTAAGNVRWNIDDLQVLPDPGVPPANQTFTVDRSWSLEARSQMADFRFNGDSNYTREASAQTTEGWRWNITSTNARSGSSWDGSPGATFSPSAGSGVADDQTRVYFLEFARPIDITSARSPAVPVADSDGDTGVPILSFWQAYDIGIGGQLVVQYTRDAINDTTGTPDTWTTIPNDGMLLNVTGSTPASTDRNDAGATRTALSMREIQVRLTQIPNWDTQSFRLRFALIARAGASSVNDWYLDDIRIEREDATTYEPYPMLDNAESDTAAAKRWAAVGPSGVWLPTTVSNGYDGSSRAFADSPSGSYTANTTTAMEMRRTLDLLNDTPANDPPGGESPTRAAARSPLLSFWWRGALTGATVAIDIWSARTNTWLAAWSWSPGGTRTQNAWERIEVDLRQAVVDVLTAGTGSAWQWSGASATSVTGNTCDLLNPLNCVDDDLRLRIRLTTGSTTADGLFIDDIRIENAPTLNHELWDAPSGDGIYDDSIETRLPNLGSINDDLSERWYLGGSWFRTLDTRRNGSMSLTDSPGTNYPANVRTIAEIRSVIDLRSTNAALMPSLDFFTRFDSGSGDGLRVEIAQENSSSTSQGYDKIAGWTAWTPVLPGGLPAAPGPWNFSTPSPTRVDTWIRGRVSLSSYVGSRIRIRFVLTSDSSNEGDGLYLDQVRLAYNPLVLSDPGPTSIVFYNDFSANPGYWLFEGNWGTTEQYVIPGSQGADIGTQQWSGYVADCVSSCTNTTALAQLLDDSQAVGMALNYNTGGTGTTPGSIWPLKPSSEVDYWLGSTRPNVSANPSVITSLTFLDDTWAARLIRNVTLEAGRTYRVYTLADDGVRLTINDIAGTNITTGGATPPAGRIINNWAVHGIQLDYSTFTVGSSTLSRTLTLDYFETTGTQFLTLNIASGAASVTDSPNTAGTGSGSNDSGSLGYTSVASAIYGYSSLVLNGVLDLSTAANPVLSYTRYYNLSTGMNFFVEFSNDGGFTWNTITAETVSGTNTPPTVYLPPSNTWQQRSIAIDSTYRTARFCVRFRLDTRTASTMLDGVWIGSVQVVR